MRLAVRAVVLALLGGVMFAAAPSLGADTVTQSLSLPYGLSIQGANGQATVYIPVPAGATPRSITGTIESTYNYDGVINLVVGGRRGAQVDARTGGRIDVALRPSDVGADGSIELSMAVALRSQEDCFADDTAQATLRRAAFNVDTSAKPPSTIAEFLSKGVESYTVVVPQDSSDSLGSAALTAVSALAHAFPTPTTVALSEESGGPATSRAGSDPLQRRVVLEENTSSTNKLELRQGELVVSGDGQALLRAAVALGDPNTAIIDADSAEDVSSAIDFSELEGQQQLSALGMQPVRLKGLGRVSSQVLINQSMFGHPIEQLSGVIAGRITPLPDGGQGRVDLLWNGNIVSSANMTGSTGMNLPFKVPTELMARDNTLEIAMSYVPPGGKCYPRGLEAEFTADPELSAVTGAAGQSLAPGFERFPQVLAAEVPTWLVGSGTLAQAGGLVASLQSANAQQVSYRIEGGEPPDGATSGLIVGADEALASTLQAPVNGTENTQVTSDDMPDFQARLSEPYGVLQGFESGGADLVMLGGSDSTARQQDSLALFAQERPQQWLNLNGSAYVQFSAGEPIEVTVKPPPGPSQTQWQLIVGVVLVIVCVVALIIWLWRRPSGDS